MSLAKQCFDLVERVGDPEDFDALWKGIVDNYGSYTRFYHNLDHIEFMFTVIQSLSYGKNFSDFDIDVILFAALYHDFIYIPTGSENEALSAEVALSWASKWRWPWGKKGMLRAAILATKTHSSHDDRVQVLIDADLASFAVPWDEWIVINENIRKEYDMYSDGEYNAGRKKVLNYYLSRDPMYYHATWLTAAAQNNIRRSLEKLDNLE